MKVSNVLEAMWNGSVRWEGGPHDGLYQRIIEDGSSWPEWRTCDCHGVAYRYVGRIGSEHVLVAAHGHLTIEDEAAPGRSVMVG